MKPSCEAALIGRYVEGISKREFLEDTLRQDAVIRKDSAFVQHA